MICSYTLDTASLCVCVKAFVTAVFCLHILQLQVYLLHCSTVNLLNKYDDFVHMVKASI